MHLLIDILPEHSGDCKKNKTISEIDKQPKQTMLGGHEI